MPRIINAAPLPLGHRLVGQTIALNGTNNSTTSSDDQQSQNSAQPQHHQLLQHLPNTLLSRKRQQQQSSSSHNSNQLQNQQQNQPNSNSPSFTVQVKRLIGEGGFSFVYLVTDEGSYVEDQNDVGSQTGSMANDTNGIGDGATSVGSTNSRKRDASSPQKRQYVLKITTVQNREMRDIADKEAMLLRNLSHPSILNLVDDCFRGVITSVKPPTERDKQDGGGGTSTATNGGHSSSGSIGKSGFNNVFSNFIQHQKEKDRRGSTGGVVGDNTSGSEERDDSRGNTNASASHQSQGHQMATSLQHMMLLEYCSEGHLLSTVKRMAAGKQPRYTPQKLIIAFGQICNAVSYLHAQKPCIVHRDLKLENFLVCEGGEHLKLCDFGSAVFGRVPLRTQKERSAADDVIQKTTTQMYRAPEMVDLYMKPYLTEATDIWALGCCLYMMAFLRNCFEEGSNLAILSGKYKIPKNNLYGDGLVEMIDRMLTPDADRRADISEVIQCLSAVYCGKPLPPRKASASPSDTGAETGNTIHCQQHTMDQPEQRQHSNEIPLDGQSAAFPRSKTHNPNNLEAIRPTCENETNNFDRDDAGVGNYHSSNPSTSTPLRSYDRRASGSSTSNRFGSYRTDGQGIITDNTIMISGTPLRNNAPNGGSKTKAVAKKLNPNSAAARRRRAALKQNDASSESGDMDGIYGRPACTDDAMYSNNSFFKSPRRTDRTESGRQGGGQRGQQHVIAASPKTGLHNTPSSRSRHNKRLTGTPKSTASTTTNTATTNNVASARKASAFNAFTDGFPSLPPASSASKPTHRPSSSASSYGSSLGASGGSEASRSVSSVNDTGVIVGGGTFSKTKGNGNAATIDFDETNFQFEAFDLASDNPFVSTGSRDLDCSHESNSDDPFGVAKWSRSMSTTSEKSSTSSKKKSKKSKRRSFGGKGQRSISSAFCGTFDVFSSFSSSKDSHDPPPATDSSMPPPLPPSYSYQEREMLSTTSSASSRPNLASPDSFTSRSSQSAASSSGQVRLKRSGSIDSKKGFHNINSTKDSSMNNTIDPNELTLNISI